MSLLITPRQFAQRAEFYHQLAQLVSAGIGVLPALEQLQRHPPGNSFREPLRQLVAELVQGRTFAESLRRLGAWFPEFDIALIEAGERSGRLDACFRLLDNYYRDRAVVTKKVIAQLIYPIGLIHMVVLVFLIILPFARSQFNASIPFLLLKAALALAPLYLLTALILYATQNKHGEKWRALMEKLLRPVPLLGAARHYLALARLAAALEALISAGVNIFEAWDLAAAASGSPTLRRAVAAMKPEVVAGRTPAEVLREHSQFPELFTNLYHSGEVSGKLDETLKRLYTHYQEEGTFKLNAFAQWMPRLLYMLVAALVAYNVIQFFIGLYGPNSVLSHAINGD